MYRSESILLGLLKNVTWLLPFIFVAFALALGVGGAPDQSGFFLLRLPAVFLALRGGALGQPVGRMERPEKDNFWDLHRRLAECYMSDLAVSGIPCCTGLVFSMVFFIDNDVMSRQSGQA